MYYVDNNNIEIIKINSSIIPNRKKKKKEY